MKRDKQLEEAAAKILYRDLQEAKTPSKSELEDGETGTAHGGMQHFSTIDGKQWVWNYALKSKSKSLSSQPGKWEYTNKKDQATAIAVSTWGGKKLKVAKMIEEDINLEEGIDIEWIESNFTVVTDDNKGNPTIEWTDGNWYRILLNKIGNVVKVEPREDDPRATRQNATKILRAIRHRTVAEDTTTAAVEAPQPPLAKMIEEDINLEEGFKTFLTKVIKLGVKIIKSETGRYVIKSAIKALAMKVASDVSKKEVSLEITDVPRDRLNIIKSAAKNNGVKMTQDGETVHILGKEDIVYDFIDDVKDDLSLEETTESQEDTDLTEATSVVTQLQDIIDQKSFKAVKTSDGKQTKVDMTTANAMLTVYKALNKQNQKRVDELMTKDKMGLLKFVDFAWNNVKSK